MTRKDFRVGYENGCGYSPGSSIYPKPISINSTAYFSYGHGAAAGEMHGYGRASSGRNHSETEAGTCGTLRRADGRLNGTGRED